MLTMPPFLCGLLGAVTFQRLVEYWPINRLWAVKLLSWCKKSADLMSWSKDARRRSSRWPSPRKVRNILSSWWCIERTVRFLDACVWLFLHSWLSLVDITSLEMWGVRITFVMVKPALSLYNGKFGHIGEGEIRVVLVRERLGMGGTWEFLVKGEVRWAW